MGLSIWTRFLLAAYRYQQPYVAQLSNTHVEQASDLLYAYVCIAFAFIHFLESHPHSHDPWHFVPRTSEEILVSFAGA